MLSCSPIFSNHEHNRAVLESITHQTPIGSSTMMTGEKKDGDPNDARRCFAKLKANVAKLNASWKQRGHSVRSWSLKRWDATRRVFVGDFGSVGLARISFFCFVPCVCAPCGAENLCWSQLVVPRDIQNFREWTVIIGSYSEGGPIPLDLDKPGKRLPWEVIRSENSNNL